MGTAAVDDMDTSEFGSDERIAFVRLVDVELKLTIGAKGLKKPFGKAVIEPFLKAYAKRADETVTLSQLSRVEVEGTMLGDLDIPTSVVLLANEPVSVELFARQQPDSATAEVLNSDPFAGDPFGGGDGHGYSHNARAPPPGGLVDFDEDGRSEVEKLKEARREKRKLKEAGAYHAGDRIRVSGLESATGRAFNGREGSVIRHVREKGRWEVRRIA